MKKLLLLLSFTLTLNAHATTLLELAEGCKQYLNGERTERARECDAVFSVMSAGVGGGVEYGSSLVLNEMVLRGKLTKRQAFDLGKRVPCLNPNFFEPEVIRRFIQFAEEMETLHTNSYTGPLGLFVVGECEYQRANR